MSAGAGEKEVEVETEEINQELGSSLSLPPPQEQDPLPSGGPLLPHPVPPPDPAAGEQKRSAWSRITNWTGPECISSSSRCGAPQGISDAIGPGSAIAASTMVNPQLEPGPFGGPYPQSAAGRS